MSGLTKQAVVLATVRKENKELRLQLADAQAEIKRMSKLLSLSDVLKDGFRDIAANATAKTA